MLFDLMNELVARHQALDPFAVTPHPIGAMALPPNSLT